VVKVGGRLIAAYRKCLQGWQLPGKAKVTDVARDGARASVDRAPDARRVDDLAWLPPEACLTVPRFALRADCRPRCLNAWWTTSTTCTQRCATR
jgi:hypothetical protein